MQKGFGGRRKGPNGAIFFVTVNLNVPGLEQGAASRTPQKGGKNNGNKGDGKEFWTERKGKDMNEITRDSSYDGVASSRRSTDPWGDYRVN